MQIPKHSLLARLLAFALVIGIIGNIINPMNPNFLQSLIVLFVATVGWFTLKGIKPFIARLTPRQVKGSVIGALVIMVVLQILILWFLPVTIYHDPYRVLTQADALSHHVSGWTSNYFWRYPNNVSIAYLMTLWLKFTQSFGLTTNTALHILSFITLDTFIVLMLKTMYDVSHHNRNVLFGGLAFMVASPFAYTYFLQVFYSDLPSLLVLLIIFNVLYRWPHFSTNQRIGSGIVLTLVVCLGQLLKPNLIVLIPAFVIVFALVFYHHNFNKLKIIVPTLLILVGFGLSVPAKQVIFNATHFENNEKYELPTVSWIAMGLNKETRGVYNGDDIAYEIGLPDKDTRQDFETQLVKDRVHELGPFGLIQQWTIKLAILLNAENPQDFYNGGLIQKPGWIARHGNFYSRLVSLIYQVATILLFASLVTRLWHWRSRYDNQAQVVTLLSIVTILGYMGFHSLVWETEPRYGQIVLPLVMFALAALPAPAKQVTVPLKTKYQSFMPVVGLVTLLLGAYGLKLTSGQPQIIAAQRSQLSKQYGSKQTTPINHHDVVTQRVDFKAPVRYFSLLSNSKTILINTQTHMTYQLTSQPNTNSHVYKGLLPAGSYEIRVTNSSAENENLDIIKTQNYRLAPYPLYFNNHQQKFASLIYKAVN
ncbi:hypothetical protein JOC36_000542 [Weissella uvarum]|uniref:hypothetical protein n=1 Tax=Weissella uvarum TaxID=1479233 RepID=UPI00195F3BCA|nr:hypothetical protein [Weissella uvarum]MBM7616993.1 hypothetical protein [Weissella uvarum]MCM0595293.1 hypothetical protein [Weissella uvarum]